MGALTLALYETENTIVRCSAGWLLAGLPEYLHAARSVHVVILGK